MREIILSACALVAVAGSAFGQAGTVEFRFRELTNQSVASSADGILDIAVEARVTGAAGRGLGDWSFDIAIAGESQTSGTLLRASSPNAIAAPYRYLAGLNGAFNGVINTSSGTFIDNPAEQEIGLVSGSARGAGLVAGGLVVDDGFGTLTVAPEPDFTTALNANFGANGNWSRLYTFRYTVSNFANRTLNFVLRNTTGATFSQLVAAGTDFSGDTTGFSAQTVAGSLNVSVIPAPASVALLGLGGLAIARRRR